MADEPRPQPTHHVKVREKAAKGWKFLSRDGTTTKRIHALQFTEAAARRLVADNAPDNPGWEFQIRPI